MKRYFSLILAIAATVSAQIVPSTGNVRGPTSATDNAVARYDGTTGKLIQNSGVTIDDSGDATFAGKVGIGVSPSSWELNLKQSAVNSAVRIISPTALGLNDSSIYIAWASGSKALIAASYESTGSYRPLVLSAGGVDSLTLDTSGNATFAGQVNILNSNSYLKADASNLVYETYAGKGHQFKTGGTTALRIDSFQGATFEGVTVVKGGEFKVQGLDGSASKSYVSLNSGGTTYIYNNGSSLILGTNGMDGITLSSAQAVRFNAYGAGTLSTDSNGNISASSDARLKTNLRMFARGLADLVKISPKTFNWTEASGLDTQHDYSGFIAQDVQAAIPEAVYEGKDDAKTLSINDRAVIAALVNAVKELKAEVDALKAARN